MAHLAESMNQQVARFKVRRAAILNRQPAGPPALQAFLWFERRRSFTVGT
jgi:hypothetical protein